MKLRRFNESLTRKFKVTFVNESFKKFWKKKQESEKVTYNIEQIFNVEHFNKWFKEDYSGYGGYPGGAKGIFLRTDKLSKAMFDDYFEEMNYEVSFKEMDEFREQVLQNWFEKRRKL